MHCRNLKVPATGREDNNIMQYYNWSRVPNLLFRTLLTVLVFTGCAVAQTNPEWTEPFSPFRIADNLYYVGSKGLANYLITTQKGHILINSDLEANVPLIRASVEQLGFKFSDLKILLI